MSLHICDEVVLFLYLRVALYVLASLGSAYLALLSLEFHSRIGAGMNGLHAVLFLALGAFLLFSECSVLEAREVWLARGIIISAIIITYLPFQWLFLLRRAKGRRR